MNPLCASNKVFVKYQAQGGGANPNPPFQSRARQGRGQQRKRQDFRIDLKKANARALCHEFLIARF